jgi:hypothetical protein
MDVPAILQRASDKCGLKRERWVEANIPTSPHNITVLVFLGDMRSSYILSSFLLKQFKEKSKSSKYFILVTWPGYEGLFPYVDEIWSIKEESALKNLHKNAYGFENRANFYLETIRNLNYWFEDVLSHEDFSAYYDNGFQDLYWSQFGQVVRYLPSIPSSAILNADLNLKLMQDHGVKIFVAPFFDAKVYDRFGLKKQHISKSFWENLINILLENNMTPVIYNNYNTYDLSADVGGVHFREKNISKLMGIMRLTTCVLDIFSDISKLAIMARVPNLVVDERIRYLSQKEAELNNLSPQGVKIDHIFSFATILESEDVAIWKSNLLDLIIARLNKFLPGIGELSSPLESETIVPYRKIKEARMKKLGTRFFKVNRDIRNEKL